MSGAEMRLARWQLWLVRLAVVCAMLALGFSLAIPVINLWSIAYPYGFFATAKSMLPAFLAALLACFGLTPWRTKPAPDKDDLWQGHLFALATPFMILAVIRAAEHFGEHMLFSYIALMPLVIAILLVLIAMHPWQSPESFRKKQNMPPHIFLWVLWPIGTVTTLLMILHLLVQIPATAPIVLRYVPRIENIQEEWSISWLAMLSTSMYLSWWRWRFWGSFAYKEHTKNNNSAVSDIGDPVHA